MSAAQKPPIVPHLGQASKNDGRTRGRRFVAGPIIQKRYSAKAEDKPISPEWFTSVAIPAVIPKYDGAESVLAGYRAVVITRPPYFHGEKSARFIGNELLEAVVSAAAVAAV